MTIEARRFERFCHMHAEIQRWLEPVVWGTRDGCEEMDCLYLKSSRCGTMNCGGFRLISNGIWINVTSVKCSDKCTPLCFYYVTQWRMQNWCCACKGISSRCPCYVSFVILCGFFICGRHISSRQIQIDTSIIEWMNRLRNRLWTLLESIVTPVLAWISVSSLQCLVVTHYTDGISSSVNLLSNKWHWFTFCVGKKFFELALTTFELALKACESALSDNH